MKNIESLSKTTAGPNYGKIKKAAWICGAALVICAASCMMLLVKGSGNILAIPWGGNDPAEITESVESIVFSETSMVLDVGHMESLIATVLPSKYSDKIVWKSADETVACVSGGVVTAIAPGITSITAQSPYGYCTAKCQVIVAKDDSATPYRISDKAVTIAPGEAKSLTITKADSGITAPVIWKSSNEKVAAVAGNGQVTAVDFGLCTVSAYSREDGSLIASCTVAVRAGVEGVTLSDKAITLSVGAARTLKADVSPVNAVNRKVTWESSNNAVTTVSGGKITAVRVGTAVITVKTVDGEKTDTCTVTVQPKVEKVVLQKETVELRLNETATLTASLWPETLPDKKTEWSSSDASVVSVDKNGKIIAIGYGTATITCAAQADNGVKATCSVAVVRDATGVSISPETATVARGSTIRLKEKVTPDGATDKSVTWVSENNAVATVDSTGLVKGESVGSTKIRCKTNSGGCVAECRVTVMEPIGEIAFSRNNILLNEGQTFADPIGVTVVPEVSGNNIKIYSTDNTVATVSTAGGTISVKGLKGGETTIVAEAQDGTGKKAVMTVSVSSAGAEAFTVTNVTGGVEITGLTAAWKSLFAGNTLAVPGYVSGKKVVSIGDNAFDAALTGITTVNLPENLTAIRAEAFARNTDLTTVNFPNSLVMIGNGAFMQSGIASATIPKNVTQIGDNAFKNCTSLSAVSMPSSLKAIGGNAFYGDYNLTAVTIPSGVTSIGEYAFYNTGLKSVVFGTAGLTELAPYSFAMTALVSVDIPSGVTVIREKALYGNTHLTSASISNTVTTIEGYAFGECTALQTVRMSEGLTSLNAYAFDGIPGDTRFTVTSDAVKGLLASSGIPEATISAN